MITLERLKELLEYTPITGIFTNKTYRCATARKGAVAGSINKSAKRAGYTQIMLDRTKYYAHRLAWLYYYGSFPTKDIDHINRDKSDNSISNLRETSKRDNLINRDFMQQTRGTCLYRGVSKTTSGPGYYSRISINGVNMHLGSYATMEEASIVYENMSRDTQGALYTDPNYLYDKTIEPVNLTGRKIGITGYRGVTSYAGNRFISRFNYKCQTIYVGVFDTAEEAHNAYLLKRTEMGLA